MSNYIYPITGYTPHTDYEKTLENIYLQISGQATNNVTYQSFADDKTKLAYNIVTLLINNNITKI